MNQSKGDFWDNSSWWGKGLYVLFGLFVLTTIILVTVFASSPDEDEDEESYAPGSPGGDPLRGARRNRLDFGNRFAGRWHPASYRRHNVIPSR